MKIVKNEKCSFCNKELEDIVHFLYECEISTNIWKETEYWINDCSHVHVKFSLHNIIFGFEEKRNDALNCLVCIVKQHLFLQKLNSKIPVFAHIKKKILQYYEDERYISSISGLFNKFNAKWMSLHSLFT